MSHKKIAWKWKVFETIRKLKCEFWVVCYMVTSFHENMRWLDAKTDKLVMQAKQPISCVELKFWPKLSNLKHECASWNFHFKSWRKKFQSKMKLVSTVWWKMKVQAMMGLPMSWKVRWRKRFFKFEEMCFELKWKVVKWVKTWVLKHISVSHLKILVWEWKLSLR